MFQSKLHIPDMMVACNSELVKIFRVMCSFNQKIGLLPLVSIVWQK